MLLASDSDDQALPLGASVTPVVIAAFEKNCVPLAARTLNSPGKNDTSELGVDASPNTNEPTALPVVDALVPSTTLAMAAACTSLPMAMA